MAKYFRCKHCGSILKATPVMASKSVLSWKMSESIKNEVVDFIGSFLKGSEFEPRSSGPVIDFDIAFNADRGGVIYGVVNIRFSAKAPVLNGNDYDYGEEEIENNLDQISRLLNGKKMGGRIGGSFKVVDTEVKYVEEFEELTEYDYPDDEEFESAEAIGRIFFRII